MNEEINNVNFIKLKLFVLQNILFEKRKSRATEQKTIFAKYIFDKKFISGICKNHKYYEDKQIKVDKIFE